MMAEVSDVSFAAAITGLAGMTPVRLAAVMAGRTPAEAWRLLDAGCHPQDPGGRFVRAVRRTDPAGEGERYLQAGIQVLLPTSPSYPTSLVHDPGAPAVLFARGATDCFADRRRVAIVGTRSATPYGRAVASELGGELASAGVTVVSGLARGIDGAAHAGAVRHPSAPLAPPVAGVGTGLDVVYPTSNRALWETIATTGVLFSESPLGTPPLPRVFPARNRIIAALADVVVVVESHHQGGSLATAEAAARRGIPVCAVPGSVRSRASEGTNGLLVDGCIPVRDAADVLVAISLARSRKDAPWPSQQTGTLVAARGRDRTRGDTSSTATGADGRRRAKGPERVPDASTAERVVWDAIDDVPTTIETILLRSDLSIAVAAEACEHLVSEGFVRAGAGWWAKV